MINPRWGHLLTAAKAARSHGVPITVLLGYREPTGKWVPRDSIMALALQKYEDGIHVCGVHSSLAFGDDNIERVQWKSTICHACESRDTAKSDNKNPYPGQVFYPTWTHD